MSLSIEQLRLHSKINSIKQRRASKTADVSIIPQDVGSDYFPEGSCTIVIAEKSLIKSISATGRYERSERSLAEAIGSKASELNKSKGNIESSETDLLRKAVEIEKGCEFFDLSFNRVPILSGIPVSNSFGLGAVTIPYSGGLLEASSFKLEHYLSGSEDEEWCGTIIPVPPRLSDVEKSVLDLIPSNVGNVTLGYAAGESLMITVTTVTIALFVVAVHCPAFGGSSRRLLSDTSRMSDSDLEQLRGMIARGDVLPAAMKMLDIRSGAFD